LVLDTRIAYQEQRKCKSLIECSLQHVLGCNVEIRFKLVPCPVRKDARLKRQSFSFLDCSGRKQELSDSVVTDEDEAVRPRARETPLKGYTCSQQESPYTMQRVDSKPTVHCCEDDARSTLTSNRCMIDDPRPDKGRAGQRLTTQRA
jgi:hypothetical protein